MVSFTPVTAVVDDLPAWELAFRFTSGRLCLALCATVGERWRRNFERLRGPEDLSRWLEQADLAAGVPAVSARLLREARELREAIYRLVRAAMAGHPGDRSDRDVVNAWARRPPISWQLDEENRRQVWTGPRSAAAGLAAVAADAVDLLSSPSIGRVRECDAPDCALLFLDSSRPGRRRWCADGACGSKARTAAYRRRQASTTHNLNSPAPSPENVAPLSAATSLPS
jgi:predicted RNA-binding Zn ribbon-like protein